MPVVARNAVAELILPTRADWPLMVQFAIQHGYVSAIPDNPITRTEWPAEEAVKFAAALGRALANLPPAPDEDECLADHLGTFPTISMAPMPAAEHFARTCGTGIEDTIAFCRTGGFSVVAEE